MNREYWLKRWDEGRTGWHQTEVEPALIKHFSSLGPTRVFVPLCGKSLDLQWLASRGHEVVGVELSESGCEAFFHEHKIPVQVSTHGRFKTFHSDRITIFNGDFFDLGPRELSGIGAIYDRAALIAMPPESRVQYTTRMINIVHACAQKVQFDFLQILFERTPHDTKGPPFSVSAAELQSLYGQYFDIEPLIREEVDRGDSSNKTEECVYRLIRISHGTGCTGHLHSKPPR